MQIQEELLTYPDKKLIIIGGGILGHLAALMVHLNGERARITIHERYPDGTYTPAANLWPSLTPDEILAVVPVGKAFLDAYNRAFDEEGGIFADVSGVNDSALTQEFKNEVMSFSQDPTRHAERQASLLEVGRLAMDAWHQLYELADPDLKQILEDSNFHPCREPGADEEKTFHNGYRIDLFADDTHANDKIQGMIVDYHSIGYTRTCALTPSQVLDFDPSLQEFCAKYVDNDQQQWKPGSGAILRPGGCINARKFLPKLLDYLTAHMGRYQSDNEETGLKIKPCFKVKYDSTVIGIERMLQSDGKERVTGLGIQGVQKIHRNRHPYPTHYLFAPGNQVNALQQMGFTTIVNAGFAGVSTTLHVNIPEDLLSKYGTLEQHQEVHQNGIVVSWQARFDKSTNQLIIGVAGMKAYHGDVPPDLWGNFAQNRGLLQLQMIDKFFPELIDIALGREPSKPEIRLPLSKENFEHLKDSGALILWVGVRAVAPDNYPSIGPLSVQGRLFANASTVTNAGSGGVAFGLIAVLFESMLREADVDENSVGAGLKNLVVETNSRKPGFIDTFSIFANPTRTYINPNEEGHEPDHATKHGCCVMS